MGGNAEGGDYIDIAQFRVNESAGGVSGYAIGMIDNSNDGISFELIALHGSGDHAGAMGPLYLNGCPSIRGSGAFHGFLTTNTTSTRGC